MPTFKDRIFKEIIKLKLVIKRGPNPITGVLTRRENLNMDVDREQTM
jgi:hypothetical protein